MAFNWLKEATVTDPVQMGYVGCGFMAQKVHIPNITELDCCELVALAEVRPRLGRKVQRHYDVPRLHGGHRELAEDPEVEAVAVSAHYSRQGDIAAELLRAGKDVFMEKPMATSLRQAERVMEAVGASGRRLMVGYMKRYDAGNELVKEHVQSFLESGELGGIQYVRNHGFCGDWIAGQDAPVIRTNEPKPEAETHWPEWLPERFRRGYLGYLQQYTHNVNLLRWFLGAGGDVDLRAVDLEEGGLRGVVVLQVAGRRAVIESGSLPYHSWEEHTQIYFDRGWVKTCAPPIMLKNIPASVEVYRGDRDDKTTCDVFPANGRSWSYKEEMRHFCERLRSGHPFRSPAADAVHDVRVLEDIYRMHVDCVTGS
ncbi:MAG: Gfo/Idh/MocA family protein [Planctomycetota bacterium]